MWRIPAQVGIPPGSSQKAQTLKSSAFFEIMAMKKFKLSLNIENQTIQNIGALSSLWSERPCKYINSKVEGRGPLFYFRKNSISDLPSSLLASSWSQLGTHDEALVGRLFTWPRLHDKHLQDVTIAWHTIAWQACAWNTFEWQKYQNHDGTKPWHTLTRRE